jgi:hypothetical protein
VLRSNPDLLGSAQALVEALARHPQLDVRASILNRVARHLGDEWYPIFIKIVCVIGDSDDDAAKKLLADSLAYAMKKGELPCGSLTSWGVSENWLPAPSGLGQSFFDSAPRRSLGPIEYLSSWHSQSTNRAPLSDDVYRMSLVSLLLLFNASPAAARVYQIKLRSDPVNDLEGTFTAVTRARLAMIAELWAQGVPASDIASRVVQG